MLRYTSCHDVIASLYDMTTYANTDSMIFLNLATQNTIETKKNHLASTSTSWDRYSIFNDVMTSFRDVIPLCKYDDNNHVEFSNQRNHRNEMESAFEHICRLVWRQFVSWRHVVILVTSWRHVSDVMTSRYDMKSSWKYIHNTSLEPNNRNNYRNTCVLSLQNIDKLI